MARPILDNVLSSYSSATKINSNNEKIEQGFTDSLSRNDSSNNNMEVILDMDSKSIINLPYPYLSHEPATKAYVDALAFPDPDIQPITIDTIVIASIAALRLLDSDVEDVSDVILLDKNYTLGDGGGAFVADPTDTTTADNGGTVIVDAAGLRWKRNYSGPVHVKWFGAVGDAATNDTTALQAALAAGVNGSVYVNAGTYMTDPLTGYTNQEVYGAGIGISILRHRGGSVTDQGILTHTSCNSIKIHDLTFDYNNVSYSGTPTTVGCSTVTGYDVYRCAIIKVGKLGISFTNSSGINIRDNYIARDTATSTGVNEGILGTSAGGNNNYITIENNRIVNTGMLIDGSNIHVLRNNVSGWKYGAGIGIGNYATSVYCVIDGNYFSNGYSGLDSDGLSCKGIEFFGTSSRITKNICFNNGGPGIFVCGKGNVIDSNICINNGLYTAEDSAGISLGYLDSTYNASGSIVSNNICYDTLAASGTQDYGIAIHSSVTDAILVGNRLYNNKLGPISSTTSQTFYGSNYSGKTTIDIPSIAAGASTTVSITVGGAALGDIVQVSSSVDMTGLTLSGYVSGTNVAVVVISNNTASPIDIGSATYRAVVSKTVF